MKSLAGEPLRIVPNIDGKIKAVGNREFNLTEVKPGIYEIDLKKGEELVLSAENSASELIITPVEGDSKYYNFFGPKNKKEQTEKQLFDPK